MNSPQLFIAFGALMLIAALLGVAIDWFGKPLRHRRFVPKVYRFPDERQPRRSKIRSTEWSETSFVLPVIDPEAAIEPYRYPEPGQPDVLESAPPFGLVRDLGPPTAQVPVVDLDEVFDLERSNDIATAPDLVTLEDTNPEHTQLEPLDTTAAMAPSSNDDGPPDIHAQGMEPTDKDVGRGRGWRPGQYVFNLTPDGREPSATTVRTRYWKNVAATMGASVFGETNLSRMGDGKPPQRLNHRTGTVESMRLPSTHVGDDGGQTPVPEWPAPELDPFA